MSSHEEGRFDGELGETYWQAWLPDDEPVAVVVIAHGASEHSGRYAGLAAALVDAGCAAYALDHRGHGRSAGTPGNIDRLSVMVEDLDALRSRAEAGHPGLPTFIIGHSMGGLLVLAYVVAKGGTGLNGVVLSGAAIDPTMGSRLERAVAPLLSRVLPNLPVADLGVDGVSRDPAVVQAYVDDPLNYHGRIRARTGAEVLAGIDRVSAALPGVTVPILVLHGGDDRMADPAGARLIHDRIGSPDKTLTIYDGLFHEIFNEPERDEVYADVVAWIGAHR